jgi:hypothetical protein
MQHFEYYLVNNLIGRGAFSGTARATVSAALRDYRSTKMTVEPLNPPLEEAKAVGFVINELANLPVGTIARTLPAIREMTLINVEYCLVTCAPQLRRTPRVKFYAGEAERISEFLCTSGVVVVKPEIVSKLTAMGYTVYRLESAAVRQLGGRVPLEVPEMNHLPSVPPAQVKRLVSANIQKLQTSVTDILSSMSPHFASVLTMRMKAALTASDVAVPAPAKQDEPCAFYHLNFTVEFRPSQVLEANMETIGMHLSKHEGSVRQKCQLYVSYNVMSELSGIDFSKSCAGFEFLNRLFYLKGDCIRAAPYEDIRVPVYPTIEYKVTVDGKRKPKTVWDFYSSRILMMGAGQFAMKDPFMVTGGATVISPKGSGKSTFKKKFGSEFLIVETDDIAIADSMIEDMMEDNVMTQEMMLNVYAEVIVDGARDEDRPIYERRFNEEGPWPIDFLDEDISSEFERGVDAATTSLVAFKDLHLGPKAPRPAGRQIVNQAKLLYEVRHGKAPRGTVALVHNADEGVLFGFELFEAECAMDSVTSVMPRTSAFREVCFAIGMSGFNVLRGADGTLVELAIYLGSFASS